MTNAPDRPAPAALGREPDGVELAGVWGRLPEPPPSRTPEETDEAWVRLSQRVVMNDTDGPSGGVSREARSSWRQTFLRVAAVAVVALGGAAAWYSVPVVHTADAGERSEVALPDGSRVLLNAGSTLRHRRDFRWLPGIRATRRAVRLEGEAFFDVASAVRPFTVEAGATRVRVLGTRFNVRARGGLGVTRIDVEEGRVEVSNPTRTRTVVLASGEVGRLDSTSGQLSRGDVDTDRVAAWRTGGIAMVDEPLGAILDEIGLRFDTEIALLDAESARARLSVYYSDVGSVESVIADLAIQQNLRYRPTSNGWELF